MPDPDTTGLFEDKPKPEVDTIIVSSSAPDALVAAFFISIGVVAAVCMFAWFVVLPVVGLLHLLGWMT